jgi:hypothetical protein
MVVIYLLRCDECMILQIHEFFSASNKLIAQMLRSEKYLIMPDHEFFSASNKLSAQMLQSEKRIIIPIHEFFSASHKLVIHLLLRIDKHMTFKHMTSKYIDSMHVESIKQQSRRHHVNLLNALCARAVKANMRNIILRHFMNCLKQTGCPPAAIRRMHDFAHA